MTASDIPPKYLMQQDCLVHGVIKWDYKHVFTHYNGWLKGLEKQSPVDNWLPGDYFSTYTTDSTF